MNLLHTSGDANIKPVIHRARGKGQSGIVYALLAAFLISGSLFIAARPNHAYAVPSDNTPVAHYVINGPWYLHPGDPTDTPTIDSAVSDLMATGTEFDVQCVATGDPVAPDGSHATDGSGDSAWEYGTDAATGDIGFVSDQGLDTQVTPGQEIAQLASQGIAQCSSDASSATESPVSTSQDNQMYNREAAVNWALANAADPQTNGEECTKFVSEALWAGGLPQTSEWNNNGHYISGNPLNGHVPTLFTGSKTANDASDLLNYLQQNYSVQWISLGAVPANNEDIPQAETGDIIAYSWNGPDDQGNYTIDHLAFVVGSDPNDPAYPTVAEWGQVDYGPSDYLNNPSATYPPRGWTYSAMNHEYLQKENNYHNMIAFLLHFNGGTYIPDF